MKRFLGLLFMALLCIPCTFAHAKEKDRAVTLFFNLKYMPTIASNQHAVWAEDEEGKLLKTLFVTDFTGMRRGYERREDALSQWVSKASPGDMGDEELDAISGATPREGKISYTWDMTDEEGKPLPEGTYHLYLEGTLYWKSSVLYSAVIDTTAESGEVEVEEKRSEPDNPENEDMITDVTVRIE